MASARFDPVEILDERFTTAIAAAFPEVPEADRDPLITPSKMAKLADFQSNGAMALGKKLGKNPREVAAAIAAKVNITDIAEPLTDASIAGPGFINIKLRSDALAALVANMDTPGGGLGVPVPEVKETAVVDLCGVNLAKQMHIGHLRAVIIGDAIARLFERLGHTAIRQNHVGDWGLPIAMVTAKLKQLSDAGKIDLASLTLDSMEKLYKQAQLECAAEERGLAMARKYRMGPKAIAELEAQVEGAKEAMAHAKQTLVNLQAHEPGVFAIWQRISDITMKACLDTCAALHANVKPEHSAGESSYALELGQVVEDLTSRGIAEVSDGALIVRVEGLEEPCIIRKSDGGYLYATTDVAAIKRRVQKLGGTRIIYCVDARQSLHFKQVFGAAHRAGYDINLTTKKPARMDHAGFGMVLGDDGRPFKTRSGENVKLMDVITEALKRAAAVVNERSAELPEAERARVAEAVGVAALKYADLSNDRVKDYVFSFDRMLAFEGNTGPYLLYALVRTRSVQRKAVSERGLTPAAWKDAPITVAEPAAKSLALALLRYPGVLASAADALEPHRLCTYLYDLAGTFSTFYDQCHVLKAPDDATMFSLLRLYSLTERVLEDGLTTLGLPTLERM
ncbi:MAG: arginine--tRNA ligase [Phycisphaeraceae bacterium]|nr:arginine--tRNA ligase [Phycisphaeraceae bacterium]